MRDGWDDELKDRACNAVVSRVKMLCASVCSKLVRLAYRHDGMTAMFFDILFSYMRAY